MSEKLTRSYQDIAIINVGKSCSGDEKKSKKNTFLYVIIAVLSAVLLIGFGYVACIKAGWLAPPDTACCFGVLVLDFDFEIPATDQ